MNTKHILILSAASVLLSSANAAYLFTETFDTYGASENDALNTLDTSWTADSAYTLITNANTDGFALFSGDQGDNAAISTTFAAQTGTFYIGVDVDYGLNSSGNFFWITASDTAADGHNAAAVFGASGGIPVVTARSYNFGSTNGTSATYGDAAGITGSVRLVMEVSKSGANGANYDTITITDIAGTTTYSSVTGDLGVSELDTFYARLGGVGTNGSSSRMLLDNISVATTFGEAATIPEPSTFALLAGFCGLASIALRRRRL